MECSRTEKGETLHLYITFILPTITKTQQLNNVSCELFITEGASPLSHSLSHMFLFFWFNDFPWVFLQIKCKIKKKFTKNNFFTVTYMYGNCKWNQKLMHQDSMFLMIGTRSIHNQIQFLYIQSPNSWLILGQFLNNTSLLLPHSSHCIITSLPLDFFISQSGNSSLSQSSFLCVLLQQYIYCLHLLF